MSHRDAQKYIVRLCNQFLELTVLEEHRFNFLRGDGRNGKPGRALPVDAYYPSLSLVIEYHERQHNEDDSVPLWDNKPTISGVSRKVQRALYDQRRRDILPKHGIHLVELSIEEFAHTGRTLNYDERTDRAVIAKRLRKFKQVDPIAEGRKALEGVLR